MCVWKGPPTSARPAASASRSSADGLAFPVLGYHGCDLSVARKVAVGDDQLLPSHNEYDWLGSGLYFRADSPARALRWAREEAGRNSGKVQTPAVLGAIIDLGNCLNLIDTEHLDLVKAANKSYVELCVVSGLPPARNKGKNCGHAVSTRPSLKVSISCAFRRSGGPAPTGCSGLKPSHPSPVRTPQTARDCRERRPGASSKPSHASHHAA